MGVGASYDLEPPRPPLHGRGASSNVVPLRPLPRGGGGLPHFGTTEAPAERVWGPPLFCDPVPPPQGHVGLLRFGTTEVPAALAWGLLNFSTAQTTWGRGPPAFWDHGGPRRMGAGASCVLGPPSPPPHVRGALHRFGTTKARAAWVVGAPSVL